MDCAILAHPTYRPQSMSNLFAPPSPPTVRVVGGGHFPIRRVFCVGRNYLEHAKEMGAQPDAEMPIFFTKPADAVTQLTEVPYPSATQNLHHEIELVLAIGTGGRDIDVARAADHIVGYAVGNDLTRRDLQAAAKAKGNPWDIAKAFDYSAPISDIALVTQIGHSRRGAIWLNVNGSERQRGDLADMIHSPERIVAVLSTLFALAPGDLIYTGTPAGVGALVPGDHVNAAIEGIGTLQHTIVAVG